MIFKSSSAEGNSRSLATGQEFALGTTASSQARPISGSILSVQTDPVGGCRARTTRVSAPDLCSARMSGAALRMHGCGAADWEQMRRKTLRVIIQKAAAPGTTLNYTSHPKENERRTPSVSDMTITNSYAVFLNTLSSQTNAHFSTRFKLAAKWLPKWLLNDC